MTDPKALLDAIVTRTKPVDAAALPKHLDAVAAEKRWQDEWERSGIFRYDPSRGRAETFAVDTPPPTVSGSLHVGHVFSYTHQDLIVRYRRMRGWNIFYPMGWDDNGLPTERRVQNVFHVRCDPRAAYEPSLDIPFPDEAAQKAKLDTPPRVVSRRNFIDLCQRVTARDEEAFRDLFRRLSLSVDWHEEYATIDESCRAAAQRSFAHLHRAGHVYQTDAPTMWDVDFQTAVAQAEVEDREKQGAFHEIEFAVEGGGSFVIATTRPELLAACVGVAAHPEDERYRPLFGRRAITPLYRVPVPIFPTTLADPAKGTGILMVCTFGDQTDVTWWREQGLPLRQIVGRDGRLLPVAFDSAGWASLDPQRAASAYEAVLGKGVNPAKTAVVEQLRSTDASALTGAEARPPLRSDPKPTTQAVKFFEKGDRPLEIMTSRQWFVRLMDKKERLIEMGRRISWRPSHMQKRFENWTAGLQMDWCISRQRYFGVPIPVWYPLDVEGRLSFEQPILPDLGTLPVDPMSQPPPGEDEAGREQRFTADPDVFDTWFTSGLSPQIAARWERDPERFRNLFPMDVRPQSHEIIRTWAFYTIVKAMLHEDDVPWRNVNISGWVLDPDRKKMSKSRGNVVTPMHLLEGYGSDAVRYWAGSANLGADTAFDEGVMKNGKRLVTKVWNAGKFVLGQDAPQAGPVGSELDRAFVAELRKLVTRATATLEEFEYSPALDAIESFFWSAFTDNYLELAKARARSADDAAGRASAVAGLRIGYSVLLRLFAPYLPVVTEEVWSWSFAEATGLPSIHRAPWPTLEELAGIPAPASERTFEIATAAIGAIRKARTAAKLSYSAALASVEIDGNAADLELLGPVLGDVCEGANAPRPKLTAVEREDTAEPFVARIEAAPPNA